jgi:hypothetical protein
VSYEVQFSFKGLRVEAVISDYWSGDREQPPEGGTCESFSWSVEDVWELILELQLPEMVAAFFGLFGRLPKTVEAKIEREFNLAGEVEEYFWHELGGPSGCN